MRIWKGVHLAKSWVQCLSPINMVTQILNSRDYSMMTLSIEFFGFIHHLVY